VIGQFLEAIDQNNGIVGSTTGSNYYVRILSTIDRELLKHSASVALHKHSNALVDILPPESDSSITMLGADEKPDVSYVDIGGLDLQKQEMREAVELPLTHFELYKQIGIDPPRGVLMFGPPGCGKTMLAKAVAHHTTGNSLFHFISLSSTNMLFMIVTNTNSLVYSRGRLGVCAKVFGRGSAHGPRRVSPRQRKLARHHFHRRNRRHRHQTL
jgi:ATP-dependent 26S proteasome regulatory subunit